MTSPRSGGIECQNDPFAGFRESFSTLGVRRNSQSMTIINLHAANGRALNEPGSCYTSLVGQPLTTPTTGKGESSQIAIRLWYCSRAAGKVGANIIGSVCSRKALRY